MIARSSSAIALQCSDPNTAFRAVSLEAIAESETAEAAMLCIVVHSAGSSSAHAAAYMAMPLSVSSISSAKYSDASNVSLVALRAIARSATGDAAKAAIATGDAAKAAIATGDAAKTPMLCSLSMKENAVSSPNTAPMATSLRAIAMSEVAEAATACMAVAEAATACMAVAEAATAVMSASFSHRAAIESYLVGASPASVRAYFVVPISASLMLSLAAGDVAIKAMQSSF